MIRLILFARAIGYLCMILVIVGIVNWKDLVDAYYLRRYDGSVELLKARLGHQLSSDHVFFPANSSKVEYRGRWSPAGLTSQREASFQGSQAVLRVGNTTSIKISLAAHQRHKHYSYTDLCFTDKNMTVHPGHLYSANTAAVLVETEQGVTFFNTTSHGLLQIGRNFDRDQSYRVVLTHMGGSIQEEGVLAFEGIWLSKHGNLLGFDRQPTLDFSDAHFRETTKEDDSHRSIGTQDPVIEIYTPTVDTAVCDTLPDSNATVPVLMRTYSHYLKHTPLFDSTTITIPIPRSLFLTTKCRTFTHKDSNPNQPTAQDLYFRSGPISTPHFTHPWSHKTPHVPSILLLELGLQDIQILLSNPSRQTPKPIDSFTAHFVDEYVKFILNIRRNIPHEIHNSNPTGEYQDASYLYNSQPSTLPIFLIITPLPPAYDRLVAHTLHHALSRVVHTLRNVQGDKFTFLIDTTGWLQSSDFRDQTRTLKSKAAVQGQALDIMTPILNDKGHRKIAYFISLILCPYLKQTSIPYDIDHCPFDRLDEYTGTLYTPNDALVDKVVEEQKIDRIKAIVGRFDMAKTRR